MRSQQGHGLEHRQDQRQWGCDRPRSPDRRIGCAHSRDAAARNEATRRKEGLGRVVYRRWYGRRAGGRALSAAVGVAAATPMVAAAATRGLLVVGRTRDASDLDA